MFFEICSFEKFHGCFCNLIILGSSFKDKNLIETLDYFAKTLRIQDSAVIVVAEKTAKESLDTSSPLDNISSFAIQKILLKDAGLDRDIMVTDIRKFSVGYYSRNSSSYLPILKTVSLNEMGKSEGESGSGGEQSSNSGSQSGQNFGNKGQTLYDLTDTALFLNGKYVGRLNSEQTFAFNMIKGKVTESLLHVDNADGEGTNYLLSILRNSPKLTVNTSGERLKIFVALDVYCKVTDAKKSGTDSTYATNSPLPESVKNKAELSVKEQIESLFRIQKESKCDFLGLDDILYKYHHKNYAKFKDSVVNDFDLTVKVTFSSQK